MPVDHIRYDILAQAALRGVVRTVLADVARKGLPGEHYFKITRRDPKLDGPLFLPIRNNRTNDTRKPLDPSMIYYIVTRYAKEAGIVHRVSPHRAWE